jgi:predicted ATPase
MHLSRVTIHSKLFPNLDRYPFKLENIQRTGQIVFESPIVFFVGENGTGKSTLLRAIAHACGIHIWANPDCRRNQADPCEAELHRYLEIRWTNRQVPGSYFSSEHFRYFSERVEEWAGSDGSLFEHFGGKSLLAQSHGESLLSFFTARYRIEGLYLLDEPDTALSPCHQLDLAKLLQEMSRAGHAQFIVATHSPILFSCPGAVVLSFDHAPIRAVHYHETEHFRVFRSVMKSEIDRSGPDSPVIE